MPTYQWRKSSYSADAGNCVNIAANSDVGIRLRESDDPAVVLDTTAASFGALIRAAKAGLLPVNGE
ncbi:DUF397 domain-containing protein [Streptomyces sp. NPDC037389]|uniref:DUF397 domain-containing protein n=1 Tax=Streptomyces sp. NPDC037389 TaxID=3155369 RepID=UPI0033D31645